MVDQIKRIEAAFFRSETGAEPVRNWLKAQNKDDRFRIGTDIKTVEFGWPIGMPTCKPMKNGLFEVRTSLGNRTARVLFCIADGRMVLLHGFIKKSQKTPQADLDLALERKRKLEETQMNKATNPYIGTTLDDLLDEDGALAEVHAIAIKRTLAWQVSQIMAEEKLSKSEMARRMHTSRAALNRLLDPDNPSVTLLTMDKAAAAVGKRLRVELVDEVA